MTLSPRTTISPKVRMSRGTSFMWRSTTRTSQPGRGHPAMARWRKRSSSLTNCTVDLRSEEHTSELQSLRHSYAVLCLRSEEHTSELQSLRHLVCRLLLAKKTILYY